MDPSLLAETGTPPASVLVFAEPTVLAVQVECPAASDLTPTRLRTVLQAASAGRGVPPDRLAEAHFCTVWFNARERHSMWLDPNDAEMRHHATAARDYYALSGAGKTTTDRARFTYLAAVMELVLDPFVGKQRMRAFTVEFPDSAWIQDAWLWIADREAAGRGGNW